MVCDAVRALARTEYRGDVELIVVDDGSDDGTAAALAEVACPFPVQVVEQTNTGAAEARNRGAAAARHQVILFLDDDMMCQPDLIGQHARCYRDGADAVIGTAIIDNESPAGFLPRNVSRWLDSKVVRTPLSPFDIFTGQLSVRREVFHQIGGFDPAFTSGSAFGNEDADFGVDLLARYDVRHNPSAISRQRYVVGLRDYAERAPRAVQADLRLIQKRPQLAAALFGDKGWSSPVTRFIHRPLSRIPWLPRLFREIAIRSSEAALKTPFRANPLLARFFLATRTLSYWSELRSAGYYPFSKRPLVLCYHAIDDHRDDPVLAPYSVPPALFARQLDQLAARGFSFITPELFAQFLSNGAPLPRRPVLLTFDDGYATMTNVARDILAPRGIGAIAFVVTGSDHTNLWDQAQGGASIRLLGDQELAELGTLGVEVGSHSRTHRDLRHLSASDRAMEMVGSAEDLHRATGRRPRYLAYPYGANDESTRLAAHHAGFAAAFAVAYDRVSRTDDRYRLPRTMILATDDGWRFRLKTATPRLFGRMLWLQLLPGRVLRLMKRAHAR